jgi:hypothetical protein
MGGRFGIDAAARQGNLRHQPSPPTLRLPQLIGVTLLAELNLGTLEKVPVEEEAHRRVAMTHPLCKCQEVHAEDENGGMGVP